MFTEMIISREIIFRDEVPMSFITNLINNGGACRNVVLGDRGFVCSQQVDNLWLELPDCCHSRVIAKVKSSHLTGDAVQHVQHPPTGLSTAT